MNDTSRRPGRVSERATPVEDSAFPVHSEPARTDEMPVSRKATATPSSAAGMDPPIERRVTEPASPVEDDTAPALSLQDSPALLDPPPRSPWSSVLWLLLACVAFWGVGSATMNLVDLWQQQMVLAAPLSAAGLVLVGLLIRALRLEWRAMRDVDALAERREAVEAATAREDLAALKAALQPTLSNLRARHPAMIGQFEAAAAGHTRCADYLRSLDNLVLQSLDAEAQRVVDGSALTTGIAVAVVPHPAFDAVLVLWRALVMTRHIGAIYGLRPTGLSAWRLLRHTLRSALLAASMDTLTTFLVDSSASALARTLKPLAEGAVIGVRFHHLGRLTMAVCRPVTASTSTGRAI